MFTTNKEILFSEDCYILEAKWYISYTNLYTILLRFFGPLLQGYCTSTLNMGLNVGCHVRSTDLRLCYQQCKASIKQLPTYYAAVK